MAHEHKSARKSRKVSRRSKSAGHPKRVRASTRAPERREGRKVFRARRRTRLRARASVTERFTEKVAGKIYRVMRRRPYLSVAIGIAGGVGIATALGVGEVAAGLVFGYATYLIIRKRLRPAKAFQATLRARRGRMPVATAAAVLKGLHRRR